MEEDFDFEAPIINFRRLIKQDNSDKFRIFVTYSCGNKPDNEFFIDTTINEARIISHKIDEIYQIDPTICQYKIAIPNYFLSSNIDQSELQEIMQVILNSLNQKVHIKKEKLKLFTMFQYLLGECDKEALKEINLLVNNQEEAIQFLNTEFHDLSIQYLSTHFLQLLQSDQINSISDQIFSEIIDFYTDNPSNEKKRENNEIISIFNYMKSDNLNSRVLMYFLMHIDFEEYNDDMIQYFDDNLNDEILIDSLPRVSLVFKKQAKLMMGKKELKKGKITECQFNGNEKTGIVAYLNSLCGGNAIRNGSLTIKDGIGSSNDKFLGYNNPDKYCYSYDAKTNDKSWLEFDFHQRKINPSSYSIYTCNGDEGPKTWEILGSNDRQNWAVLDRRENREETKAQLGISKFDCSNSGEYYQYIRFTEKEAWYSGRKYYMHIKCIEFFGSILEPE